MSIKNEINKLFKGVNPKQYSRVLSAKKNEGILNELIKETSFLKNIEKLSERIYCIENNIKEQKLCYNCNKTPVKFKWLDKWYAEFCSVSCSRNNWRTKKKQEKTTMDRYWVKHNSQSKDVKKRKEETFMKNYWYKNWLSSPEIQEKIKQTNIKKYWVEKYSQTEQYLEKIKQNNLKKYGIEFFFQTDQFKKYIWNLKVHPSQEKHVIEKRNKTNMKKYGTIHPLWSIKIQNKMKITNMKKYGTPYTLSSPIIRKQIEETNMKKYWYKSTLQTNEVKEKIKQTNKEKYWYEVIWNYSNIIENLEIYKKELKKYNIDIEMSDIKLWYKLICNECWAITEHILGKDIYNRVKRLWITPCLNCHPLNHNISWIENKVKDFLSKIYNWEIEQSNRKILNGKEIDLLLEDIKLWIEINWLYWHSDQHKEDKNYHYDKTQLAKEKWYQLLHFFDDEITQSMELMYSLIAWKWFLKENIDIEELNNEFWLKLSKPNKYQARKLVVKIINVKEKKKYKEILRQHHIQWDDNAKYYYSLETKEWEILSIMTFKTMSADKNQKKSNEKIENSKTFELSRYVTIPWLQIIWGFNRLIWAFKKEIGSEYSNYKINLLTYSNLRYSEEENNVYLRNWFDKEWFTWINYYYFFEWKKYHRFNFRKDNLYNKYLPERWIVVDEDYTKESERWMVQKLNDHWYPINKVFDCGHIKWSMDLI